MRDIKFRAWGRTPYLDNPSMTKPFDFKQYVTYSEGAQERLLPTVGDDVVYMQYTGLKDKNGVEIYEGDIVRCTTRMKGDKRKLDEDFISEVFWEVDTFLVHDSPRCDSPIGTYDGNNNNMIYPVNPTIEVIGNIYENPELLKEGEE